MIFPRSRDLCEGSLRPSTVYRGTSNYLTCSPARPGAETTSTFVPKLQRKTALLPHLQSILWTTLRWSAQPGTLTQKAA
jgi:hypothetical protein